MTTRWTAIGTLLVLLSGCNALKLVSGGREGLPCSDEQGCGEGYACVDGVCVKDTRDGGTRDGGTPDGGTPDGGTPDGGTPDGGTRDGGTPDGGTRDGGTPDGGTPDGGTRDGGTRDGGTPDGGTPDGGTRDGGTPDGGTRDGGTPDGGTRDGGAAGDAAGRDLASADTTVPDTASADGATTPPWTLTVIGTGFGVLDNTQVIGVLLDPDGVIADSRVTAIGNSGTFTLQWPAMLQPATSYRVHFFLDFNTDGWCDYSPPPPGQSELAFEVAVGEVTGPRSVTVTGGPSLMPSDRCASFNDGGTYDLTIAGTGFNEYTGQTLHLELFADWPPVLVASDSFLLADTSFTRTMEGVLAANLEYQLSWYFDTDVSASCSQDDAGGHAFIGTPVGHHHVDLDPAAVEPYGCLNPCDLDKDFVLSDSAACMGTDCDDDDNQRYPGNIDLCGDSIDQDCSGGDAICDGGGMDGSAAMLDVRLVLQQFPPGADFNVIGFYTSSPGDPEGLPVTGSTFDDSGAAQVSADDVLVPGHEYTFVLFVNVDGLEGCNKNSGDQVYSWSTGPMTMDLIMTVDASVQNQESSCELANQHFFAYLDGGTPDGGGPPWG